MERKRINTIALFAGSIVLLIVAILYFASAGTARLVANSIDNGIQTLVENSNDSTGEGIALALGGIGVGISAAAVFLLRVLGVIHLISAIISAVLSGFVMSFDEASKPKRYKGFTIWILVRHFLFCLIHLLIIVFMGLNVRSLLLIVGLLASCGVSIWAAFCKKKRKYKDNYENPVIHM